jgi:hypothetical protein
MLGVLVGNKADFRDDSSMDSRAEITKDEGQGAAKELGLKYFETSAVSVRLCVCVCVGGGGLAVKFVYLSVVFFSIT